MNLKRWFRSRTSATTNQAADNTGAAEIRDLERRLRASQEQIRERTEALYALQRQYSSEHFELTQSMRELKIERMRNAGAYAARDILIARYSKLQARIQQLKGRLRAYEKVDDLYEDTAPIVINDAERGED